MGIISTYCNIAKNNTNYPVLIGGIVEMDIVLLYVYTVYCMYCFEGQGLILKQEV